MRRLLILVAASVLALGALPSPVGAELFVSSQNNHTVLRYDAGAGAFIPPAFVTAASGELDGPTFLVFRSSAGILTLSEWAQIGMAALLVGGGLLAIRRRAGGSAFSDQPPAIG